MAGEITRLTGASGRAVRIRWEAALHGRAALLGLVRQGRTSANGSCRLLAARDGDVALNLPRADDISLIPALTGDPLAEASPWEAAATLAAGVPAAAFVERARLLGLAASSPGERAPGPPYAAERRGEPSAKAPGGCTVIDLSALWAGPVAARILAEAGAELLKVEDPARPDAARQRPEFYSWVHMPNEKTRHLSLTSPSGRQALRELLESADVVIESSRPRALEQIGLGPAQVRGNAGQVWLSITGHGRDGAARDWTGFGDDAAIAGGLHGVDGEGRTVFCGDAIADPVAGLVGALSVLRSLAEGGGQLLDVSLSGAAAWAAAGTGPAVCRSIVNEPVATSPAPVKWISSNSA